MTYLPIALFRTRETTKLDLGLPGDRLEADLGLPLSPRECDGRVVRVLLRSSDVEVERDDLDPVRAAVD